MMNLCFVIFLLLTFLACTFAKDCAPDLSSVGDSVITLSDELSDAYTAEERCEELGGYLAVTREAQVKQTVISGAKLKYARNTERVWIYYNKNADNHYKYLRSSNEALPWVSTQELGHLWYLDLYTSSPSHKHIPIYFCAYPNPVTGNKWLVQPGKTCAKESWKYDFVLYGLQSPEAGYKAIYAYDQGKQPYSTRLIDVVDDYNGFTRYRRNFSAPVHDVFVGAQFDTTSNEWKWSDGEPADEFDDKTHDSCQQKIWSHLVDQELNTNCNQTQAFYSCQYKFTFQVTHKTCDSTVLDISWNLLPLAQHYSKTMRVTIEATNNATEPKTKTVIDKDSSTLSGLTPGLIYLVQLTARFTDCADWNNIIVSQEVEMGPGRPSDVTHGHVLKSKNNCDLKFANPLRKGEFHFSINVYSGSESLRGITGSSFSCNEEWCTQKIPLSDYTGKGKLHFEIKVSNCEGETAMRTIAGNCFAPTTGLQECSPTLTSRVDSVLTLSDDILNRKQANDTCSMFGGKLANIGDGGQEDWERILNEKYIPDIQRIWIYRRQDDSKIYKYAFSNISEPGWEAPSETDHLRYLDLYNRDYFGSNLIHFCKASVEKWQVSTSSCNQGEWQTQFSLYGSYVKADGFKKIYMFISTSHSVKLKTTKIADGDFTYVDEEVFIPDLNIHTGETSTEDLCPMLHYGENWESTSDCSGKSAYYTCNLPVILYNKHIECDSTEINIAWDDNLLNLSTMISDIALEVTISTGESEPIIVDYKSLDVNVTKLTPRNNYTTTVNINANRGCSGLSLATTIQYETGLGTPDDVTSAYVTTSADKLFINVPEFVNKPYYDERIYKVLSTNGYEDEFKAKPGGIQKFTINPNHLTGNEAINFTIMCSTCEGESTEKSVSGSYFVPTDDEVCSTMLIANGDRILTLSDERKEISALNDACGSIGGQLANITADEQNNLLIPSMNVKYLQDVQRVWIYDTNSTFSYSLQPLLGLPSESSLEYIDMLREESLQTVTFCDPIDELVDKWQVGASPCGKDGWKEVFALFASSTPQTGHSPIYILTSKDDYSSKLSKDYTTDETFTEISGTFYVPDFNVFVANEDNTECSVTTLQYGHGWNEIADPCSVSEAYYSCQVEFTPVVREVSCNSSKLQVSWSQILNTVNNLDKNVLITGKEFEDKAVEYDELTTTITGLVKRTTYNIQVTAVFGGCLEHSIHHELVGETSYGLADPVINARIDMSSSICTIVMPQDESGHVISYMVAAASRLNVTYHEYKLLSSGSYVEIRMNISTEYHGNDERINFKIQAVTCEGSNEWEPVEGFCTSAQAISPPTPVAAIVGSIFGILAVIALCAGGFVYYKRHSNLTPKEERNSTELDISDLIYQVGEVPVVSMSLKELLFGSYLSNSENEFSAYKDDFEKIKEESSKTHASNEVSKRRENALKNRYTNIFPMDHARVKLIGNAENDYINASYIPGYKDPRKFIAAQGPRPATIDDFWMMIWENSSPIVVMLTGLKESGKTKCEKYWPEVGCSTTFGNYRINTLEENVFGAIIQRKFNIATLGEQRMVTQFHYIGWPDHGTPITTTSLIRLRKMVEESHNSHNPIVVHCSAGVGRTGTYIAMDVLFDQADIGGKVDVNICVLKMRESRSEMVQNWKQYALINKLVLEYVTLPDSDRNISKLQRMSKAQLNQLARYEFVTIQKWRYGDVWITGHNDVTTYKSNTVKLWSDKLQEMMELNASYIEDLMFGGKFIAAQCPLENNEEEFWQMLLVRRAHVVVCLDETASFEFRSATRQFSDITLDFGNFYKEGSLTVNNVAVQSGRQESFEVCVIQANSWKSKPPTADDLFKLIAKMQEIKARKQGEFVVVCCKNGCDKTGTLIALVNILERLKSQNRVDVFRTIKDLRDMRPNMLDSLELYSYCYSVVLDYLSLFNAYDNFNFKADSGVEIALE